MSRMLECEAGALCTPGRSLADKERVKMRAAPEAGGVRD